MPLIKPLSPESNKDVAELAQFFNEPLGFCPNSILTMQIRPAIAKSFINLNKAVMDNQGRGKQCTEENDRLHVKFYGRM